VSTRQPFKYPPQLVVDLFRLAGYAISKLAWFIRYEGLENIPRANAGGLLVVSNHQTYIDPVWIVLPMRRKLRFMAFNKAFEWPMIGDLISYLGAFSVAHDGPITPSTIKTALGALRDGAALIIFPEGGRSKVDGEMAPFRSGAINLATRAGVPILPVTIVGGNRIWPQKQKYPNLFRRVRVIYHPVIKVPFIEGNVKKTLAEESTLKLREIIARNQLSQFD